MNTETIFTRARIVMADEVVTGSLHVVDGRIHAIDSGQSALPQAIDLAGDYLLPGLVELHTDNLEKHFSPRPGVRWPPLAATIDHDAQIAAAGITTVLDAVALGEIHSGGSRLAILDSMVEAIQTARARGALRADHRLHLRCEISHPDSADYYRRLAACPLIELVSIMDHTPGQRQFVLIEKYREYYQKKHHLDDAAFAEFNHQRLLDHVRYSGRNRRAIVALAREHGHRLASHDDATAAHVAEAVADGMVVAEFPTTNAAAEASRAGRLAVLMGAPNVLRGGSHSGNISAIDLERAGLLDILSSDYVPGSLIQAPFRLAATAGIALPQAVAKVSRNPARAIGLDDRGEIATGFRADLVHVAMLDELPLVRSVWREGNRII